MLRHFIFCCICYGFSFLISNVDGGPSDDVGYTHTVYIDDKPTCTATLISRFWALTTCLCVREFPPARISVRIANPYKSNKQEKYEFYRCSKLEIHPECINVDNKYSAYNDIALIQLETPFFDSNYILIVKLPNQLQYWTPDNEAECTISSYIDYKDESKDLQTAIWAAESKILHPKKCTQRLRKKDFVFGKNTCATYHHPSGQTCDIDIGAPLVSSFVLVGLMIHKEGCGSTEKPASFVNVPLHSKWIKETCHKNLPWDDV